MIRRITTYIAIFMLAVGIFIPAAPAHAGILDAACSRSAGSSATCQSKNEGSSREGAAKQVQGVINLILMLLGILSVIMIIIGGYQYVTSGGNLDDKGNSAGLKRAKNTILYSCIGLIIAIMSYAIVNFVVDRMSG